MLDRILTSVILGPLVILGLMIPHPFSIATIVFISISISLYEYTKHLSQKRIFGIGVALSLFVIFWEIISYYQTGFIEYFYKNIYSSDVMTSKEKLGIILLIGGMSTLWGIKHILYSEASKKSSLNHFFGMFWIVSPLICIFNAQLYFIKENIGQRIASEMNPISYDIFITPLLFYILVQWAGDTGGILFGKLFGRHLLAPTISPNKTREGSIGYSFFSLLASWWLAPFFSVMYIQSILVALFVAVLGQIGDLSESKWKRLHDVKDSGRFLPGHGGLLDRLDSLLLSSIPSMLVLIYF